MSEKVMNEIMKKRIEEAAKKYAANQTGLDYIGEVACEKGFIEGTEYSLSHQFISVKEALPEYDEDVIVTTGHPFYSFCHRSNKPNVQTDEDGWCNYTGMKILDWMPIPKLKTKSSEYGI